MKRPLLILAVCYCLGIVLANLIRINFWIITALAIIGLIGAILWRRSNRIFSAFILFLALLIGCLNLRNSWVLSNCHVRKFVAYRDSSLYWLNGNIVSQPEFKNNHLWFIFRVRQIQSYKLRYKCCGLILVKLDFEKGLDYGDSLTLIGKLDRPASFSRSRSYRDFLARQGIYLIMHIQDYRQIIRRDKSNGFGLIQGCFRLRFYFQQVINRHLGSLPASILAAMILGQKRDIPWLVNNTMVKSGTVHILVVSGFNVGIVALILNLLFKIMRFRRKVRIILIAICLLVYCLITGATNPVIRATVMGLVFLMAYFFKSQPDILNSLVCSAIFILAINPRQLFDIGFQLSFASVLAIVSVYPKLKDLVHLENCRFKILKFIAEGFLVSFSAWLGTVVIVAGNFRIVSLITVLANILVVPLATLITICGFTLVLSGLISPDLATLFSLPTAALITLLLNLNAALIKLPFAFFIFDKAFWLW